MKNLLLSLLIFSATAAQARLEAHPKSYIVEQANCSLQERPGAYDLRDVRPLLLQPSGDYLARLPGGATATLHSSEGGYGNTFHTLKVQSGGLEVEKSGLTWNPSHRRGSELKTEYVRLRGRVEGLRFFCEVAVSEVTP